MTMTQDSGGRNRTRLPLRRAGAGALLCAAVLVTALSGCSSGMKSMEGGKNDGYAGGKPFYDIDGPAEGTQGEGYLTIEENPEVNAGEESTVTFSLKVDTAAYSNVARYINTGNLPPKDAVRTEEMLNYFRYETALDFGDDPFAVYTEIGPSPFHSDKHVAFVRVKTPEVDQSALPPCNLTFLIDTSGSMNSHDKLPLLKTAFGLLVETLDEDDRVSIVTYAGSSNVVLDSVSGDRKTDILDAIYNLEASGSTAGADGIQTAYALAQKNFRENGNNRVILATDGDFNVGLSSTKALGEFISEKRDGGVYLSILGFGTGNLQDGIMETLSKDGNGNYSYIDTVQTAKKVLVEELGGNMFTVADDVKAQVVFDPELVSNYRLIGYENRMLQNEDFEDDRKDAGEIGAGTDVVALFEIGLTEAGLKAEESPFEVRIRYKDPGQSESRLFTKNTLDAGPGGEASTDFGFACSVAAFGHLLRGSDYTGEATVNTVMTLAEDNLGHDPGGYRQEYLTLLREYQKLAG